MLNGADITASDSLTIAAGAGTTGDLILTSATGDATVRSMLGEVNIFAEGTNHVINTIGSIVPFTDNTYTLGTTTNRWADAYIGPASLHFGDGTGDIAAIGAVAGAGGTGLSITGSLIPSTTETYDLGTATQRWNSIFVGPATINIAGPAGSNVVGTIGTDSDGIVFTESGFASPFITVGPEIVIGSTFAGAIGGWKLYPTGVATAAGYDLIARQNSTVIGGAPFGPEYSLIQAPLRSIGAGTGLTLSGTGTTGQALSLASIGAPATAGYPSSISINAQGQVTTLVPGSGSVGPLTAGTSATAYESQLVLYNTATHAMSYASNAYSCVIQDGSGTVVLDSTLRGRTYIVKQNGAIITFTHSLTANDGGFFVIVKNGNGVGSGGDISISGASGNTTVHQTTSTQNGQIVYVFWDGSALTAY